MNVSACNIYDARCNLPTSSFFLSTSIEIVASHGAGLLCIDGAAHCTGTSEYVRKKWNQRKRRNKI